MAKYEILNWKTVNGIYTAGNTVEDEMRRQGIEITNGDSYTEPKMAAVLSPRSKFEDLFERYCEIRDKEPEICFTPSIERQMIETKNPLVREAYERIGAVEVRRMKYHQSNGVAGFGVEETDMDTVSQGKGGTPEDIRQPRNQEDRKGNRHRRMVRGEEGEQED